LNIGSSLFERLFNVQFLQFEIFRDCGNTEAVDSVVGGVATFGAVSIDPRLYLKIETEGLSGLT